MNRNTNTNPPNTIDTPRFRSRVDRFVKLESLCAPPVILTIEARLIFEAGSGGRWKAVWEILTNTIRHDWEWFIYLPIRRILHRWIGLHFRDESGVCYICDDGLSEEDKQEIADAGADDTEE